MLKILKERSAGMALLLYDKASIGVRGLSDFFKLKKFSFGLSRRMSKPAALLFVELFVAASLTVNFFFLVKPQCLPKQDGNTFNAFLFSYLSHSMPPPAKDAVSATWRTRLMGPIVSGKLLDAASNKPLDWLSNQFQNIFGFYHSAWLFLLFLALIWFRKDALLVMLGVFAGLMYNFIQPAGMYVYPWDMPALFFFTLACLFYDRRKLGLLITTIVLGGLFKETVLCCALLILLGEGWTLKKRIVSFFTTVAVTFVINKCLLLHYGVQTQLLSMGSATSFSGLFGFKTLSGNVQLLFSASLNHVLFVNAGSLLMALLLPWRNWRDVLFKLLLMVFIAGEFYYGRIIEFRDWYEVLPLGWMLLSERISLWRQDISKVQIVSADAPARRIFQASHWLTMTTLLIFALGVFAVGKFIFPENVSNNSQQNIEPALLSNAENGDVQSQLQLGILYQKEQDYDLAIRWFQRAAEKGSPVAQNDLGMLFANVQRNYTAAATWFQKAADANYPAGEYNVGALYENGVVYPRDIGKAMQWYFSAARQGNAPALLRLGQMYHDGIGVNSNNVEAYKWFALARMQGAPEAEKELTNCAAAMTAAQIQSAEQQIKELQK